MHTHVLLRYALTTIKGRQLKWTNVVFTLNLTPLVIVHRRQCCTDYNHRHFC